MSAAPTDTVDRAANMRHDLDAELVVAQVENKVADHERQRIRSTKSANDVLAMYQRDVLAGTASRWRGVPEGPAYVDPIFDAAIARERNYYAFVRVIELPVAGNRFVLAYGEGEDDAVTSGTGPFESVEAAAAWFFNGGR